MGQDGWARSREHRRDDDPTLITTTDAVTTDVVTLRVGTRKGAWTLTSDTSGRDAWTLSEPTMLGHVIQHVMADPRDPHGC